MLAVQKDSKRIVGKEKPQRWSSVMGTILGLRNLQERTTLQYRKWVTRQLIQKDSKLALGILLMLIDPDIFEPPIGKEFSGWNTPQTEYDFDHAGAFTELETDMYHYSGGETKFGYSST